MEDELGNLVVKAIKVQDADVYIDGKNYYNCYTNCPYCKTKNNLGNADNHGYYIRGQCNKVFYLR